MVDSVIYANMKAAIQSNTTLGLVTVTPLMVNNMTLAAYNAVPVDAQLAQITQLQSDKTAMQGQITTLTGDKTVLQGQVTSLTAANGTLTTQNATLTASNTSLTSTNSTLTSQNAALQSQINAMGGDASQMQRTIAAMTEEQQRMQGILDKLARARPLGKHKGMSRETPGDFNQSVKIIARKGGRKP